MNNQDFNIESKPILPKIKKQYNITASPKTMIFYLIILLLSYLLFIGIGHILNYITLSGEYEYVVRTTSSRIGTIIASALISYSICYLVKTILVGTNLIKPFPTEINLPMFNKYVIGIGIVFITSFALYISYSDAIYFSDDKILVSSPFNETKDYTIKDIDSVSLGFREKDASAGRYTKKYHKGDFYYIIVLDGHEIDLTKLEGMDLDVAANNTLKKNLILDIDNLVFENDIRRTVDNKYGYNSDSNVYLRIATNIRTKADLDLDLDLDIDLDFGYDNN